MSCRDGGYAMDYRRVAVGGWIYVCSVFFLFFFLQIFVIVELLFTGMVM